MNKTITLEFPEKKLEAFSHFLKKKDTTIEAELDYALTRFTSVTCRPPSGNFWRTPQRTAHKDKNITKEGPIMSAETTSSPLKKLMSWRSLAATGSGK